MSAAAMETKGEEWSRRRGHKCICTTPGWSRRFSINGLDWRGAVASQEEGMSQEQRMTKRLCRGTSRSVFVNILYLTMSTPPFTGVGGLREKPFFSIPCAVRKLVFIFGTEQRAWF
mmetsp:Transcript_11181/g.24200  ORF Transcript_11181/g.24200 Transcript_11181/m.24200 type:complete len:116 (+) Transcript_11181:2405-2752(+)